MAAILLAVLVVLTGCGGPPNMASMDPSAGGPAAFTLALDNGDLAKAHEQASLNCRAQGRTAQLVARHRDRAEFRCR